MAGTVRNNTAHSRFELDVEGVTAYVSYHEEGGAVSLDHTLVPEQLGGRGIGSALAKGALELLQTAGRKVIPRCSYIAGYIEKHPEYRNLVA